MTSDVIEIAQKLIACPSVTPKDAGAQVYLAEFLTKLGFECHHLQFEDVPNLFARIGTKGPHFCYAGHTDVVPPGPEKKWTSGPFSPQIRDGQLYGRGASDMKGSVAAFAAAAATFIKNDRKFAGSISLLITGDEEGPSINGTDKVLEWMEKNGHIPDVALVGEPTNPNHLGQEIKIGRRGSLNGVLKVQGKQGHVAYPDRADNPVPRLLTLLQALEKHVFDQGNEFFPPTNLEITSVEVGSGADNVIPDSGTARFNIRYNNTWKKDTLSQKVADILEKTGLPYDVTLSGNSESFMTEPGEWSETVKKAVQDITGKTPQYTTGGGTSDARFIFRYCPVVEFGGVNETIHQIDERAGVEDLKNLAKIYTRVLELYFKP